MYLWFKYYEIMEAIKNEKLKGMEEYPLMDTAEGIVLFHPHIPRNAKLKVSEVLDTRWIGQGPKVEIFEKKFNSMFGDSGASVATGSGTDALHLAYILAGLQEGDEVIAPLFTCTATNIPFLYMGVKVRFADIQPYTLNIDPVHVEKLITEKTKAIVCVHYGGLPCDMDELLEISAKYNIPIIEDAAHALGATYKGRTIGSISDFTMFSFQAIKHITTGDGGMLIVKDPDLVAKAHRIRWFGIDRLAKQQGHWENDIKEVGYKYQMTDIAAALGLEGLNEIDEILVQRRRLLARYEKNLEGVSGVRLIGTGYTDREHAAWLCTVEVDHRENLMRWLRENKIESGQVHYRNDRYSIFGVDNEVFPAMDRMEDRYLVLPLHTHMGVDDVDYICNTIKKGW
jgi:Predicted pyridoxal phosphate-dependent enzyme apparently involved in regulation of cell wall biogenesis